MQNIPLEDRRALEQAIEAHERAPLVGLHIAKLLQAAGHSSAEISLAAHTMTSYID